MTLEDLTHDDPAVEIAAAVIGITDALHHHADPGFLIWQLKAVIKARRVRGLNAKRLGAALFAYFTQPAVKKAMAELSGIGRQVTLVPLEGNAAADSCIAIFPGGMRDQIPPEIVVGLDRLKLRFDILAAGPPLASMWDDYKPATLAS